MKNTKTNKSIIVTVLAIAFLVALNADTSAQRPRRGAENIESTTQAPNRQQAAAQEIQKAAQDLDTTLVGILEMVNQQQKPAAQDLEDSNNVATAAKKHAKKFNEAMQCELFMLLAWNSYFEEDIKSAALNATQAYKTDQTNNDAHATQTAIAILADRKPLVIAPPRQRPTARNQTPGQSEYGRGAPQNTRTRNPGMQNTPAASNINMNASSGNILQFDPDAVDISMIGKTVTPMKLTCVNSTSMEYNPAQANLCIMFWQIESKNKPAEPNDPSATPTRTTRPTRANPNDPYSRQPQPGYNQQNNREQGRGDYGRGDYGRDAYAPEGRGYGQTPNRQNGDPLTSQMEAYGKIFQTRVINPQVKFVAINTNAISDTPEVLEKMLQNPWPWANAMAANPASGASQFADITTTDPKLVIVDRSGTIKYAGPAEGFLAPMIIDYLSGQPAPAAPLTASIPSPAKSVTNNNPTTTAPQPQTTLNTSARDTGEITPDDYQAAKLLEYAKMFVQMGRKPKLTSKKGVDTCRQIIKDYPQSSYAQEARMLLRAVPEYERTRYNITDAEMGL